jgi:hypothetical protein
LAGGVEEVFFEGMSAVRELTIIASLRFLKSSQSDMIVATSMI